MFLKYSYNIHDEELAQCNVIRDEELQYGLQCVYKR